MNSSFPLIKICTKLSVIVTVLNYCLTNTRKMNRSCTFWFIRFYKGTMHREIMYAYML
jgi:hypothetical protein